MASPASTSTSMSPANRFVQYLTSETLDTAAKTANALNRYYACPSDSGNHSMPSDTGSTLYTSYMYAYHDQTAGTTFGFASGSSAAEADALVVGRGNPMYPTWVDKGGKNTATLAGLYSDTPNHPNTLNVLQFGGSVTSCKLKSDYAINLGNWGYHFAQVYLWTK